MRSSLMPAGKMPPGTLVGAHVTLFDRCSLTPNYQVFSGEVVRKGVERVGLVLPEMLGRHACSMTGCVTAGWVVKGDERVPAQRRLPAGRMAHGARNAV